MLKNVCCQKLCCCAVDECNLVIVRLFRTSVHPAKMVLYTFLGGAALMVELLCVHAFCTPVALVRLQTFFFFFFFSAVDGHLRLVLRQSFFVVPMENFSKQDSLKLVPMCSLSSPCWDMLSLPAHC